MKAAEERCYSLTDSVNHLIKTMFVEQLQASRGSLNKLYLSII